MSHHAHTEIHTKHQDNIMLMYYQLAAYKYETLFCIQQQRESQSQCKYDDPESQLTCIYIYIVVDL